MIKMMKKTKIELMKNPHPICTWLKLVFYLPLRIVPPALLAEGGGRGGKLDLSKIRAVGTIRLKTKLLLG